jgi:hypothetical protein
MAACLAIDGRTAVQEIKYSKLKAELLEAEQVLGLAPDRRTPEAVV